jgi:hypothetical protein
LGPPRDGDRSSGEDGMVAEVIPLRRRARDGAWAPHEAEPDHSGVFDPPPDPEPPEEYSVWERPTAELVRREPADQPRAVASHRRSWASVRTWHAGGVALVAVVGTVLALALESSHRSPQRSADSAIRGDQLGLGAPLSAGTGTRTQRVARAWSLSPRPRGHHWEAHGSVSPTRSSAGAQGQVVQSASVAPTRSSLGGTDQATPSLAVAPAIASTREAAHAETVSATTQAGAKTPSATAAREFGFER